MAAAPTKKLTPNTSNGFFRFVFSFGAFIAVL